MEITQRGSQHPLGSLGFAYFCGQVVCCFFSFIEVTFLCLNSLFCIELFNVNKNTLLLTQSNIQLFVN